MLGAMVSIRLRAHIRAPLEQVWWTLSHHEGFADFSALRAVRLRREGTPDPDGLGAIRVMHGPGLRIEEEVVSWDPPHAYEYRLLRGAPIRDHRGRVSVSGDEQASDVEWNISFRPVVPGTGWLLRAALERAIGSMLGAMTRQLERGAAPR